MNPEAVAFVPAASLPPAPAQKRRARARRKPPPSAAEPEEPRRRSRRKPRGAQDAAPEPETRRRHRRKPKGAAPPAAAQDAPLPAWPARDAPPLRPAPAAAAPEAPACRTVRPSGRRLAAGRERWRREEADWRRAEAERRRAEAERRGMAAEERRTPPPAPAPEPDYSSDSSATSVSSLGSADLEAAVSRGDAAAIAARRRPPRAALFAAAARRGDARVLRALLRAPRGGAVGATVDGATALHAAAGARCAECVAALLGAGADVGARDRRNETPLHRCCAGPPDDDAADVARLLSRHPPRGTGRWRLLDAREKARGWTALRVAVEARRARLDGDAGLEVVDALIEAGASPAVADARGRSPLAVAAAEGDAALAVALCDGSLRPFAKAEESPAGPLPLQEAVRSGDAATVDALAASGRVDLDARERGGDMDTALTAAARAGRDGAVRVLVDRGADVFRANGRQRTPLFLALSLLPEGDGPAPTVEVLARAALAKRAARPRAGGASFFATPLCAASSRTPLQHALRCGRARAAALFVGLGAPVDVRAVLAGADAAEVEWDRLSADGVLSGSARDLRATMAALLAAADAGDGDVDVELDGGADLPAHAFVLEARSMDGPWRGVGREGALAAREYAYTDAVDGVDVVNADQIHARPCKYGDAALLELLALARRLGREDLAYVAWARLVARGVGAAKLGKQPCSHGSPLLQDLWRHARRRGIPVSSRGEIVGRAHAPILAECLPFVGGLLRFGEGDAVDVGVDAVSLKQALQYAYGWGPVPQLGPAALLKLVRAADLFCCAGLRDEAAALLARWVAGLETEDGARDKFGPRIPDVDLAVRCLDVAATFDLPLLRRTCARVVLESLDRLGDVDLGGVSRADLVCLALTGIGAVAERPR